MIADLGTLQRAQLGQPDGGGRERRRGGGLWREAASSALEPVAFTTPGVTLRAMGVRRVHIALLTLFLSAANASLTAQDAAPPPPPKPPEQTPEKRLATLNRFLGAATLTRSHFARALSSLPPDLAATAADPVFHEYAQLVGAAREAAANALFLREGDTVSMPPLSQAELLEIAERTSKAFIEATAQAARELSISGAIEGRSSEDIEADLFRVCVARKYQSSFAGSHDDRSPGYDVLIDFDDVRRVDADIRKADAEAKKDRMTADALNAAVASYRQTGAALGKRVPESAGVSAIATRLLWGAEPPPEWITKLLAKSYSGSTAWVEASYALAEAIERHLSAGGDPRAAARWRLRTIVAMSRNDIVVESWGQTIADTAVIFGASGDEMTAIKAVMDEATLGRCERAKATLAAYRRWTAELKEKGLSARGATPSDALLRAHQNQMTYDKSVRDRVLGAISSALLREELARIDSPELSYRAPRWLETWRESQQQNAGQTEAPTSEGDAP